jgi:hypothetical protein
MVVKSFPLYQRLSEDLGSRNLFGRASLLNHTNNFRCLGTMKKCRIPSEGFKTVPSKANAVSNEILQHTDPMRLRLQLVLDNNHQLLDRHWHKHSYRARPSPPKFTSYLVKISTTV